MKGPPYHRVVGAAFALLILGLLGLGAWQANYFAERRIGVAIDAGSEGLVVSRVEKGLPADRAGIRPGDLIVAVDGVPVPTGVEYDGVAREFHRHRPVPFTIRRDGETLILPVEPGVPLELGPVLFNAVVVLSYLLVGLLALPNARSDPRARLLAAFSGMVALELAIPGGQLGPPALALASTAAFHVITGIQLGLLLHLASVIPKPAAWLRRHPWIPAAYYGVGITWAVLITATLAEEILGKDWFPWSAGILETTGFSVLMTSWAVAVIGILVHQVRASVVTTERSQAMLVLLGLLPWALYTVLVELAPRVGLTLPGWILSLQLLVLLPYPIAVLVAITRHHLLDIELVVRRGLVYSSVTLVLVVIFYTILGAGSSILAGLMGSASASVWLISAATLLVGLLFWPLRNAIQGFIDRKIFPSRLELRSRLVDLAAHLPLQGSLSAMGQRLVRELTSILGLRSATLLVADPKTGILVVLASTAPAAASRSEHSLLLGPDDPAVDVLRAARRPMDARELAAISPSMAQRLQLFDASLATGLVSGKELTGVLLLGPKADREPWKAEELDLIKLFSHNVATVFENVRLLESATYEGLTGLLRREAVLEQLTKEARRAARYRRPLVVIMADIDHFKKTNDVHGHLVGDAVLKNAASVLSANVRGTDIVGRYGGEEFLLVFPETRLEHGLAVAEKLRRAIESASVVLPGGGEVQITMSFGLTAVEEDQISFELEIDEIIRAADVNLLEAKRRGRNRVVGTRFERA